MDSLILAWVIFCLAIAAALMLAVAFIRFLHHNKEDEYVYVTVVCGLAVFIILLVLVVIPVDIYSVSSTRDRHGAPRLSDHSIQARMDGVRDFYYVLYGTVLFFAFLGLPFVYFFEEERDPDTSDASRLLGACKWSAIPVVILVILLIVGALVTGSSAPSDPNVHVTFQALLDSESKGEATVGFPVMCLVIVGYLALLTYTATGLAIMPVGMVKPSTTLTNIDREDERVAQALLSTKDRLWEIDAKAKGGRRITKRDAEARKTLVRSSRQLERRAARVKREKTSCWRRTIVCCRPFEVVFGLLFAALGLFLIVSLLLSFIDRARSSTCGYDCGYLLLRPQLANPFDLLMVSLSRFFPLDYVFMFGATLFVFASTTAGLFRIDVRILCCLLARVRRRRTSSQGLVFAVFIILVALMAFSCLFVTLAPSYSMFGSQVYATPTGTSACSLEAPVSANCTLTELGTFVTRVSIKFPFVGTFMFVMPFLVVVVYLLSLVVAFLVRDKALGSDSSDSDDFV